MALPVSGQVGPQVLADGTTTGLLRQGRTGDTIVSKLHGELYELAYRNALFSVGMGATALSANTITLTATTTPILGVWNPSSSSVSLSLLRCALTWYANTLTTPQSPGPFVFASSVGNTAISTGLAPFSRKTMLNAGSQAKGFAGATALTGLTNNLVVFEGMDIPSPGILAYGTVVPPTASTNSLAGLLGLHDFHGSVLLPPGGVFAVLNTTSTTTFSVAGRLLWEEVPL